MGLKFAYFAAILFPAYPSERSRFDRFDGNSHKDRGLCESQIFAIIREQQIFRGKYATVEHE